MERLLLPYSQARTQIKTGDLLLYAPTRWAEPLNRAIARRGPSPPLRRYAHAGMAVWSHRVLLQVDMLQGVGGRVIRLSREVERFPGQYDVYRVCGLDVSKADKAAGIMLEAAGSPYGWESLGYAAASQYGILPAVKDDALNGSVPHCAQLVSKALREAGCDPMEDLADRYTTPNHLACSRFSNYQFTLGVRNHATAKHNPRFCDYARPVAIRWTI